MAQNTMTTQEKLTDLGADDVIKLMTQLNEIRSNVFIETWKMREKIKELSDKKQQLRDVKAKPPECLPDLW